MNNRPRNVLGSTTTPARIDRAHSASNVVEAPRNTAAS